jgi:DNA-binding transcriptional LysR family regulator
VDRWEAMRVFVAVVESRSFVRAAEKLGLSTTATSRLLAELESHLGTRLLQRTTRRLHLTEAGQRFFERAGQLLVDLEEAEEEVGSVTHKPSGVLRTSVPMSFGMLHLAPLFPEYLARYPDVKLEVSPADRIVDLVEEGFDLAIRLSDQLPPTYVARQLVPIRFVVCASPEYLARHGEPQTPDALAQHNCLTHVTGALAERWTLQGPQGPIQASVRGAYRADNGDLLRAAALAGQGIILEPTFIIGEDLAQGRLVPLLLNWPVRQGSAMAVYPSRRFVSAKVRTFVEFLQEAFAGEPPWDRWSTVEPFAGAITAGVDSPSSRGRKSG